MLLVGAMGLIERQICPIRPHIFHESPFLLACGMRICDSLAKLH